MALALGKHPVPLEGPGDDSPWVVVAELIASLTGRCDALESQVAQMKLEAEARNAPPPPTPKPVTLRSARIIDGDLVLEMSDDSSINAGQVVVLPPVPEPRRPTTTVVQHIRDPETCQLLRSLIIEEGDS